MRILSFCLILLDQKQDNQEIVKKVRQTAHMETTGQKTMLLLQSIEFSHMHFYVL